jgi:hypothetical protein
MRFLSTFAVRAARILTRVFGLVAVVLLLTALVGLAVWGFIAGRDAAELEAAREKAPAASRLTVFNGEAVVRLDLAAQQQSGIQTVALHNGLHHRQVRAYGAVADLQPLAELNHSYVNAHSQLRTAQARLAFAKAAFERAQTLYRGSPQTISLAQFQTAEASFQLDQASAEAAEAQLRALTQTARQLWGPVLAQALVEGAPMITRLIEREDVLVQLTLRPGDLMAAPANALVQSDTGSPIRIQYASAASKTDARIQGASFFYIAPATSGLQPGMHVLAFIESEQQLSGVDVPTTAVVWLEGRSWVFLQITPDSFARREIATDVATANGYVVEGFPEAAKVVTRGAQMLLSEQFRSQIRVGD